MAFGLNLRHCSDHGVGKIEVRIDMLAPRVLSGPSVASQIVIVNG